jgi:hypothetical protein
MMRRGEHMGGRLLDRSRWIERYLTLCRETDAVSVRVPYIRARSLGDLGGVEMCGAGRDIGAPQYRASDRNS